MTHDGLLHYIYDGWNRLVEVQQGAGGDLTTTAAYTWDGLMRRITETSAAIRGIEESPGDGGDSTVHYYYDDQWRIVETRNGSNQATRQWVWGTQYVDELILMDVNGDVTKGNDCDPDILAGSESSGDTFKDRRYFYHQDRNWNVVALSEYEDGPGTDGLVAERYLYTSPYGEFVVLTGQSAGGALSRPVPTSPLANPFTHQGLPFDAEKGSFQNRFREYFTSISRFAQRDLLTRDGASNLYQYEESRPTNQSDPVGLTAGESFCQLLTRIVSVNGMDVLYGGVAGYYRNVCQGQVALGAQLSPVSKPTTSQPSPPPPTRTFPGAPGGCGPALGRGSCNTICSTLTWSPTGIHLAQSKCCADPVNCDCRGQDCYNPALFPGGQKPTTCPDKCVVAHEQERINNLNCGWAVLPGGLLGCQENVTMPVTCPQIMYHPL